MSVKKQLLQYKGFYENGKISSLNDLDEYIKYAAKKNRRRVILNLNPWQNIAEIDVTI